MINVFRMISNAIKSIFYESPYIMRSPLSGLKYEDHEWTKRKSFLDVLCAFCLTACAVIAACLFASILVQAILIEKTVGFVFLGWGLAAGGIYLIWKKCK